MLTTALAILGSVTGVVGLGLSIMNTRHNIGAETRARQEKLQWELRRILRGIDDELDHLSKSIDYGQDAPEVGPITQDGFNSLSDLAKRLTRPDPPRVKMAGHAVNLLKIQWDQLVSSQASAGSDSPKSQGWFTLAAVVRDSRDKVRNDIKPILDELSAIDKGA